ncbi:MAG: hypothetical protein M3Q12_05870 [Pseudomonadota bacterium]|nr:hypothetical protein [Pseudomonadota bacterium]
MTMLATIKAGVFTRTGDAALLQEVIPMTQTQWESSMEVVRSAPAVRSYDDLLGLIYEAARDPVLLKEALAATVAAVSAKAGSLTIVDRKRGTAVMAVSAGTSPMADFDYVERYGVMDPRAQYAMTLPVGEWVQCHRYIAPGLVEKSPFYQDFLIPYGFRWNTGTRIFDNDSHIGMIGIHSGVEQLPLDGAALAVLERLTPHWQRALELQRGNMALYDQWTMMRALLNAMGYAALVCDTEGAVVVANDAAFELLRSADGITLKGDRLQLQDIKSQRHFRAMLNRSNVLTGPAPGATAHPTGPDAAMIVVRPSGKASLQLILRKLQADQTLLQQEGADRFVLTISDPASVTVPQMRAISLMYALTPAECRLAQLLLRGATLSEAADELDVSLETVRSQLKSVFSRTSTSRQTELVALLKSAVVLR